MSWFHRLTIPLAIAMVFVRSAGAVSVSQGGPPHQTARASLKPSAASEFAMAVVESFEAWIKADDAQREFASSREPSLASVTAQLTNLRIAATHAKHATALVGPFLHNRDLRIRKAAEALARGYRNLFSAYALDLAFAERVVKFGPVPESDLAIHSSHFLAQVQDSEDQVGSGADLVAEALVDPNRVDAEGLQTYLRITTAERASLVDHLRFVIGGEPKTQAEISKLPVPRVPALVLYQWLQEPWKSSDVK